MRKKSFFLSCTLIIYTLFFSTIAHAVEPDPLSNGNGTITPYEMTLQASKGSESTDLYIKVLSNIPEYNTPDELKKVQVKLFDENGNHIFTKNFFNIPLNNGLGVIKLNDVLRYQNLKVSALIKTNQSVDQEILREGNITVFLKPDLFIESVEAPQITLVNSNCGINVVIKEANGDEGANFRVEILEDSNVLAFSNNITISAGGTHTENFNLNFKQPGNHNLKARVTQVIPGEDDVTNNEAIFSVHVDKLPAPQVISVEAADNGNGTGLNAGDTITIKFDKTTNQPLVTAKSNVDNLIDFGSGKSLGSNYKGVWLDPQTLSITVLDAAGSNITVGDLITIKSSGNLANADNTSENCNSSYAISGTFGNSQIIAVHFKDPNLESSIRTALNIHQGDITNLDMAKLTRLIISYKQIKDLSGLEYAINISLLYLKNNLITDLAPISNLQKLKELYLDSNPLQNISGLSNLKNLQILGISQNPISDISPLKNLTTLQWIDANSNQINDISALKDLINMQDINLSNNLITDVSALENLKSLYSLNLSNNNISNINRLSNLTNLTSLSVQKNQCSDASALQYLVKLKYLNLEQNKIEYTSFLGGLTDLTQLYMGSNNITDISSLVNLISIDTLDISNNPLSDISALEKLIKLNSLKLNSTKVSVITPLKQLKSLQTLYMSSCEIIDISALSDLPNLYSLVLSGNKITDISSLKLLTNLHWVNLSGNQINDISPLVTNSKNSGIGQGDYVDLTMNQLDLTNGSQDMLDIQALNSSGAIVKYTPQLSQ